MNDERNELAALTQALQQTLQRRRHLGARRLAPGPAAQPDPTGQPTPAPQNETLEPRLDSKSTAPPKSTAAQESAQPAHASSASPETQRQLVASCLDLKQLHEAARNCQACSLHKSRTQVVFADGSTAAQGIFFVGEAPESEDDRTGTPFTGPAGQLLTDIIVKGMGLGRDQVTISNLVKCLPPEQRPPSADEIALCGPFLQRQIELIQPRVLVSLGEGPSNFLLGKNSPLSDLRDHVFESEGRRVVPTYHPAQLLQEPAKKRDCWSDIQRAMAAVGIKK